VNRRALIAGAPISWGVIEVPDWGHQMDRDRVLREAAELGLEALEAGPEGFLPQDPAEVSAALSEHGLGLVGGFLPAVLHDPGISREALDLVERRARFFSAAGADTLVLAAATGSETYDEVAELDDREWKELFENLSRVEEIASNYGLTAVVHPHYGTVIESDDQLRRFLEGSEMGLCLDTGHLVIGGSDPVEIAELAGDRVNHVHLKDADVGVAARLARRELNFKEAAQKGAFRPLGGGDVDVGGVVGILEASGYRGYYVLEQDTVVETEPPEGEGPVNDIRKSLQFLKTCLDGSR
jgi:inosose dehydratase